MTQDKALTILKSGRNVFLTGIAGAGKTFVLLQYIAHLKESKTPFAVTASTGIVAAAIDGTTIHSFSALGIRDELHKGDLEKMKRNKDITSRIRGIKVIIVDEISMLSAQQLDMVDEIFRFIREDQRPFGGLQVVFCGDFLQLPPVRGDFAFKADSWQQADLAICYLDLAYRQKEGGLLDVLNAIRRNEVNQDVRDLVNDRVNKKVEQSCVLFTHNVDVDSYNETELRKLTTKSHFYKMESEGDPRVVETLKRNCLSPENLEIKEGAKVMVTKNIFSEGVVNGTLGTVKKCGTGYVEITTFDGKDVTLEQVKWATFNHRGGQIAAVHQIPLRLAYAITVHKSQGMTLDSAVMNLSRVFQSGQGYVALSRLRSLDFLSLEESVNEEVFRVSWECLEYEQELIRLSKTL